MMTKVRTHKRKGKIVRSHSRKSKTVSSQGGPGKSFWGYMKKRVAYDNALERAEKGLKPKKKRVKTSKK